MRQRMVAVMSFASGEACTRGRVGSVADSRSRGSNDVAFIWLSLLCGIVRGSLQETAPRKTAEKTVKLVELGSMVGIHCDGGEISVVVTTLLLFVYDDYFLLIIVNKAGTVFHVKCNCGIVPVDDVTVEVARWWALDRECSGQDSSLRSHHRNRTASRAETWNSAACRPIFVPGRFSSQDTCRHMVYFILAI